MTYLDITKDIYKEAAINPNNGLCCTTTPVWQLPGLKIPDKMLEMNYGCGSTVHPRDLANSPKVLYVGIGGGMELLQFAYFTRTPKSVVGVDPVKEMIDVCRQNLTEAENQNDWFSSDFVELKSGDALNIPLENDSVDVAAQNCLFNIFRAEDLKKALKEMYRVLKPRGRLVMSDPVCGETIPAHLQNDSKLRALCLTGAFPLQEYINAITSIGFGTVEVRAKRPYRVIDKYHYKTDENIFVESVEVCAIKDPMPKDGPCVFTGRTAIYFGTDEYYDDNNGHVLKQNMPLAVCDKTANALSQLNRNDIIITDSTYFYDGGGCC